MSRWTEQLRTQLALVSEASSGVTDGQLLAAAVLVLAAEVHALTAAIAAAAELPPAPKPH